MNKSYILLCFTYHNCRSGDSNIAKVTLLEHHIPSCRELVQLCTQGTRLSTISSSPTMLFCFGTSSPLNVSQEEGTFGFIKSTKFGHAKILLVPVIVSL
ncbi:hypothetical protein P8452_65413 [Trifolium repens]|nr:hypothetical protein P8452_65413 [Trifolium repens]